MDKVAEVESTFDALINMMSSKRDPFSSADFDHLQRSQAIANAIQPSNCELDTRQWMGVVVDCAFGRDSEVLRARVSEMETLCAAQDALLDKLLPVSVEQWAQGNLQLERFSAMEAQLARRSCDFQHGHAEVGVQILQVARDCHSGNVDAGVQRSAFKRRYPCAQASANSADFACRCWCRRRRSSVWTCALGSVCVCAAIVGEGCDSAKCCSGFDVGSGSGSSPDARAMLLDRAEMFR